MRSTGDGSSCLQARDTFQSGLIIDNDTPYATEEVFTPFVFFFYLPSSFLINLTIQARYLNYE